MCQTLLVCILALAYCLMLSNQNEWRQKNSDSPITGATHSQSQQQQQQNNPMHINRIAALSALNDKFEYITQGTLSANSYLPLTGIANATTLTGWQFEPQNASIDAQARVVVLNQNTSGAFQGALPITGSSPSLSWWVTNLKQAIAVRIPVAQARSTTILYQQFMNVVPGLLYHASMRVSGNRLIGLNGTVAMVAKFCDTLTQVRSLNQVDRAVTVVGDIYSLNSVTTFVLPLTADPQLWTAKYLNYWTAPPGVTSIWFVLQVTGTSDTMDASLLVDDFAMLCAMVNPSFENPPLIPYVLAAPSTANLSLATASVFWSLTDVNGMAPSPNSNGARGRECIPSRVQICSNYTPSAQPNAVQFAPDAQQFLVLAVNAVNPITYLRTNVLGARPGARHVLSFWMAAVCENATDSADDLDRCGGTGAQLAVDIGSSTLATITARVYVEDNIKAVLPAERRARQWRRVVTRGFNAPLDGNIFIQITLRHAVGVVVASTTHSEVLIDQLLLSPLALVTEQAFVAPVIPFAACTLTGMSWINSMPGTGLILWLKADEGVIVSNAVADAPGKVTAWLDQSAMGNDALLVSGTVMLQSNYSLSQPRPWVNFAINSAIHSATPLNYTASRTIAIVTRLNSLAPNARAIFTQKSASNVANSAAQDYWTVNAGTIATPNAFTIRGHANAIQHTASNVTLGLSILNQFVVLIATLDQNAMTGPLINAFSSLYTNGVKDSMVKLNSAPFAFPQSNGGFVVGGDWDRGVLNATQGGTVDIAEVALWNRTLSVDELSRVGHYFTSKYQLNASNYSVPITDRLCVAMTNETNLYQSGICRNAANCSTSYDVNGTQLFNCSCQPETAGVRCEIAKYCKLNLCWLGSTCLNQTDYANYTCTCPPLRGGTFCNLTLPYVPNRQDCSRWPFGVYTAQPCDGPLGVGMVYPPDTVCDCCCDPKHQNAGTCICR